MTASSHPECAVAGQCGGCPWLGRSFEDQVSAKREAFATLWREVGLSADPLVDLTLHTPAEHGLRDRTDLQWRAEGEVLGLVDMAGEAVVAVGPCPSLSARLRALVQRIAGDPLPIGKASLRLRVSPDGHEGLWIDAANLDLKALLDEDAWLRRRLDEEVIVELGQRTKPVDPERGDRLKLAKRAILFPWFQTWLDDDTPAFTYGPVGGYTQPSHVANTVLVRLVREAVEATGVAAGKWLELGSGTGNLTLPLAAMGARVRAVEVDAIARHGMLKGLSEAGLDGQVRPLLADLRRLDDPLRVTLDQADGVLADPPREGLGAVARELAFRSNKPAHLVLVSAYADTLVGDLQLLVQGGYRVASVVGVDPFPQTPRAQWVVRLTLA